MDSQRVRRAWAERSGEYSPDYYAYHGPNEASAALCSTLEASVGRDASVLELGCSAGRHLAHLHEQGFTELSGIEINRDAIAVMAHAYPDLYEAATVHLSAFQEILPKYETDELDAVFSVETLQHVHPDDDWVFDELARIASVVVTVENEQRPRGEITYVHDDLPLFHRDWHRIFTGRGLEQDTSMELGRCTLRRFSR